MTLLPAARRWSQRLDHPAYGCFYLALAEARNTRLITQDQRLLRRLGQDPQAPEPGGHTCQDPERGEP